MTEWLNGLTTKLVIALIVATGLLFVLRSCRVQQYRTDVTKMLADAEKKGVTPDIILARMDNKDSSSRTEIEPYTIAFGELQQKCREPRADLAVMAAEIVRYERRSDAQTTYLDGLEYFSAIVEGEFERFPARCTEAFTGHIENYQNEDHQKNKLKSPKPKK